MKIWMTRKRMILLESRTSLNSDPLLSIRMKTRLVYEGFLMQFYCNRLHCSTKLRSQSLLRALGNFQIKIVTLPTLINVSNL